MHEEKTILAPLLFEDPDGLLTLITANSPLKEEFQVKRAKI